MTTFDAIERGTATSRPVELFEFGARGANFRYCGGEDDIEVDGRTYVKASISRGAFDRSADSRLRPIEITIPSDGPLVDLFVPRAPPYSVTARILRLQRDELPTPIPQVIFLGTVTGISLESNGHVAKLGALSVDSFFSRVLPRYTYQSICNHDLYGNRCKAKIEAHTLTTTCTEASNSPSGSTIVVQNVLASGMDFKGGIATIQGSFDPRMVIKQDIDITDGSARLVILSPFNVLPVGQLIELTEGCDHLINGDCGKKFDVVENFGGYAWVPNRDFFSLGIY